MTPRPLPRPSKPSRCRVGSSRPFCAPARRGRFAAQPSKNRLDAAALGRFAAQPLKRDLPFIHSYPQIRQILLAFCAVVDPTSSAWLLLHPKLTRSTPDNHSAARKLAQRESDSRRCQAVVSRRSSTTATSRQMCRSPQNCERRQRSELLHPAVSSAIPQQHVSGAGSSPTHQMFT